MTNYEKIHAMNTAELAAFLEDLEDNWPAWNVTETVCSGCNADGCTGCNLVSRWLAMEVEA